jgi:hypothetical protein
MAVRLLVCETNRSRRILSFALDLSFLAYTFLQFDSVSEAAIFDGPSRTADMVLVDRDDSPGVSECKRIPQQRLLPRQNKMSESSASS